MSRSSEEVLLVVSHVKHKKTEGILYMMGTRMAWMPRGKDSFTISHNYITIKSQKISAETKEKIQLQIVLQDSGADTFHFINPQSRAAAHQDRESVKELLQQLLPKFKRKVNSELEAKNKRLQADANLFQLYKDLVVGGIMTADEFWASRADESSSSKAVTQDVGVSTAFLADIKPQTDGCNGLKYNLTPDIMQSIFRTYPAVRDKHLEYVPSKMTEEEFWTRFFQSHYFHRDRFSFSSKDLFADCVQKDEDSTKLVTEAVEDPLVDMQSMTDHSLGEGYGVESSDRKGSGNAANSSLIKRFNQHSTLVLKASIKKPSTSEPSSSAMQNGTSSSPTSSTSSSSTPSIGNKRLINGNSAEQNPSPLKKARMKEKLEFEDLLDKSDATTGPALRLTNMDRYLQGPTQITAVQHSTTADDLDACHAASQDISGWTPRLTMCLKASSSLAILGELSPGGSLMRGYSQQQLHQIVPNEIRKQVKNLHHALSELLRHFWACFPVTTPVLEQKLLKMKITLEKFQVAKMNPLKEQLKAYHYSVDLLGHLEEMLLAAYKKFSTWQARRSGKK